jgi:hypothetical protein
MAKKTNLGLLVLVALVATALFAADKYISSSGDIILKTAAGKKVNLQDALYTTQAGNVGIGTTTPTNKLHIRKASSGGTASGEAALVLEGTDGTRAKLQFLSTDATGIDFGSASTPQLGFINYFTSGDQMRIGTGSTTKMTVLSGGNVGIGTTAPATKLDVTTVGAGDTILRLGVGISGTAGPDDIAGIQYFKSSVSASGLYANANYAMCVIQNSGAAITTEAEMLAASLVTVKKTGEVGIGTTAPSYPLEVIGNATGTTRSGANSVGQIGVAGSVGITTGQVFTFTPGSAKLFTISTGGGIAALVFCDYYTNTITLLVNTSGTFEASSTPSSGKFGIYKNATSHDVYIKAGTITGTQYLSILVIGAVSALTSPS